MLRDPGYQTVLVRLKQSPPKQQSSPLDSHPSLAKRLEMLDQYPYPEMSGERDLTPAIGLLPTDRQLFLALQGATVPSNASLLPWQQWLDLLPEVAAITEAKALVRAVARITATPTVTLGAALDLLERGQGTQLAAELAGCRPEDERAAQLALHAALFSLIGQTLVATGRASWRVSWTGPSRLITDQTSPEEIYGLIDAAVWSPIEVRRLRIHLALIGLDVTIPVMPTQDAAPAGTMSIEPVIDIAQARELRRLGVLGLAVFTGLFLLSGWVVLFAPLPESTVPYARSPFAPLCNELGCSSTPLDRDLLEALKLQPPTFVPRLLDTIVLQPGDTLQELACSYQTTVEFLQEINNLGTSTLLRAGQPFLVPTRYVITTRCQ